MPNLVPCLQCGSKVRADKLVLHQQRVHGWLARAIGKSKPHPSKTKSVFKIKRPEKSKPSTVRKRPVAPLGNRTIRITPEAFIGSLLRKHANDPHKCALPKWQNMIIPPNETCESCKTRLPSGPQKIGSAGKRRGSCRTCRANVVPGENYCYHCLGD